LGINSVTYLAKCYRLAEEQAVEWKRLEQVEAAEQKKLEDSEKLEKERLQEEEDKLQSVTC